MHSTAAPCYRAHHMDSPPPGADTRTVIVALSDSHCAGFAALPEKLRRAIESADIVIHAGDHTQTALYDELLSRREVVAVAGNMDSTALKVRLPHRQLFTAGGATIGVVHGSGAPWGIAERVRALFPESPDIIVFGHSHVQFDGVVRGARMVNPGPAASGYAVIRLGAGVEVELVTLTDQLSL